MYFILNKVTLPIYERLEEYDKIMPGLSLVSTIKILNKQIKTYTNHSWFSQMTLKVFYTSTLKYIPQILYEQDKLDKLLI